MFPWESDDTGEEATPTWALTGTFKHHISADFTIAAWNYSKKRILAKQWKSLTITGVGQKKEHAM